MSICLVLVIAGESIFEDAAKKLLVASEGRRCGFRMFESSKFQLVVTKLAELWKVDANVLSFIYNGKEISANETLLSLSLKQGEYISVKNVFRPSLPLEPTSPSTFLDDLRMLLNDQDSADFIFKFGKLETKEREAGTGNGSSLLDKSLDVEEDYEKIYAHKCLLRCRSEKFRAMFKIAMEENKMGVALVENHSPKVFLAMLEYLYTDQATFVNLSTEEVMALLVLADEYMILRLKELCELKLVEMITVETLIHLLNLSGLCQTKVLKRKCVEYFKEHTHELHKHPNYEALSQFTIE